MCQGFLAATCRSRAQKRDSTLMLWNSATFSGNFDSMWASALLLLQYASFRVKLFSFSVNSQVVWRLHVFINWKLIYWVSCIFLRNIYIHTLMHTLEIAKKEHQNFENSFRKLVSILDTWKFSLLTSISLCERCPNTEFFLVHIFLYSEQKRLGIWTHFTQWDTWMFSQVTSIRHNCSQVYVLCLSTT